MAEFRPFGEVAMTDAMREKADERLGSSFRAHIEREFVEASRATVDMAAR